MSNQECKYDFKLSKIILSVFIIGGVISLLYINALDDTNYITKLHKMHFETQKNSFENIKNRIMQVQQEYNCKEIELWLNYPFKDACFEINKTKVNLTEQEIEWIDDIYDFGYGECLSRIIYTDERVLFGFNGNGYAIVYSVNGRKPEYMSAPNEYWKSKRKYFKDGWYYFTTDW